MCSVLPDMPCFGKFDDKMHEVDKILWIEKFYHNYANFICFRVLNGKQAGNTKNEVLCCCSPNQVAYEGVKHFGIKHAQIYLVFNCFCVVFRNILCFVWQNGKKQQMDINLWNELLHQNHGVLMCFKVLHAKQPENS